MAGEKNAGGDSAIDLHSALASSKYFSSLLWVMLLSTEIPGQKKAEGFILLI